MRHQISPANVASGEEEILDLAFLLLRRMATGDDTETGYLVLVRDEGEKGEKIGKS